MYAVALIIIVLCLLIITYKNPRIGYIALAILLAAAILFYWLTPTDSTQKRAGPLTDYANLSNAQVKVGYADSFELTARVTNGHQTKPLEGIFIQSVMSLCKSEAKESCVVLGDETNLLKQYVPARQAIDFSINLRSKLSSEEEGVLMWEHVVVGAQ